jgi:hypothetical protein
VLLPALLAGAGAVAARLIPAGVDGAALEAVLLGGGRWLFLVTAALALVQGRKKSRRLRAVTYAVGAALLAGVPACPSSGPGWKLVSANVQAYSPEGAAPMEAALAAMKADVLITLEKRGEHIAGMRRVADNFDEDLPRPSHGTAVFCREGMACEGQITEEFGVPACGMPIGLVRVDQSVCVVGLHLPPPVGRCKDGRGPYISEVSRRLQDGGLAGDWGPCLKTDSVVLIGDLNTVTGGRVHRHLLGLGFADPQRWRGIHAVSWPAGGGWPNLPLLRLDHLLAGDGVEVGEVGYEALPDSDHKALVATVH